MPTPRPDASARFLPHELWRGIHETARSDAFGGALLLASAAVALVLANTGAAGWYEALRDFRFGAETLHLDLSVGAWASDGLLAIFFFVVGLELKEEFVAGRLRDPRTAALPIAAAFGGVAIPALIFTLINLAAGAEALRGWAVPTATDIAFAVAVLAVVGRSLPTALRVFLLTLAIVDDLIAIAIIAFVYAESISLVWLALTFVPIALFGLATQRGVRAWWVLVPLAVCAWGFLHASGIHSTVAGVLLGFTVPVEPTERARVLVRRDADGSPVYEGLAAHFADRWGLVATLVAVPIFAFFSAGVTVGGLQGMRLATTDSVTLGVMAGLILGKPIGILGTTFLLSRHPAMRLDPELRWPDLAGMSFVAGIGFTVSLLVAELAYGADGAAHAHAKIGVLLGSLIAAVIGGSVLAARDREARRQSNPAA